MYTSAPLNRATFALTIALCGAVLGLILPATAEAKSVQWATTINGELQGSFGFVQGVFGLQNPTVTITYLADILRLDTHTLVTDGAIIPVGTDLRLRFTPHIFEHISWFGTGHAFDTPFGDWVSNAEAPTPVVPGDHPTRPRNTCSPKDFVQTLASGLNFKVDVYVPLAVNPPDKAIRGIDNLLCGPLAADGTMECVAIAPGTTTAVFNFAPTFGKFYLRRFVLANDGSTACYGGNTPLHKDSTPYILQVPTQTIPITFTVVGERGNSHLLPPAPPVISGPTTGVIDTPHTFSVTTTDPQNSWVQYGLDWTGDTVVDQWLPSSALFVAPNTPQPFSRLWTTTGAKTFQAKARNTHGLESGWAFHTIMLTDSTTIVTPTPMPTPTPTPTPIISMPTPTPTPTPRTAGSRFIRPVVRETE